MARPSEEKRKAAAIADLLSGDQPAVVAARYGFPNGTVRQWKNRLVTPLVTESVTSDVTSGLRAPRRPAIEAQQLAIGDLILANVRTKLMATEKIADYVTTASWLDKQNASDVATLLEVLDRSAIGILDRLASNHARTVGARDDRTEQPSGDDVSGTDLPGGG